MKTIISIDPGASGGIAWSDGSTTQAQAMPDTRGDVIGLIRGIVSIGQKEGVVVAYHEKINGYIPDGGPSMMFAFGASCERVSCILETLGVRIIEVTPQAWQKSFGFGTKGFHKSPSCPKELRGEAKKQWQSDHAAEIQAVKAHNATAKKDWKNKLKAEAQRRFPSAPVTLRTADALLILDYATRTEGQPKETDLFL